MLEAKFEGKKHKIYVQCIFPENHTVYENVEYGRARQATDDNLIRPMRVACWLPKVTNIPLQYVIPTASPLQQCLHDRT
jgi:hypothetical protein